MLTKDNLIYFDENETSKSIKDYAKKLWNSRADDPTVKLEHVELIQKIQSYDFCFLDEKEKEQVVNLLQKENVGLENAENEIFEKKFFFFFALLDFIIRKKIPHELKYLDNMNCVASFEGEFGKEFENIQDAGGTNPLSFYSSDYVKIDFSKKFTSVAKRIGKYFICDMLEEEYSQLLKKYVAFKAEVEKS